MDVDVITDSIHILQGLVKRINKENGWFDDDRRPLEDMMLIVTEVAEATEAIRDGLIYTIINPVGKPEGFPSEIADIFIRLLDTCERYNIDLVHETLQKLDYNKTRGYKHGGKTV